MSIYKAKRHGSLVYTEPSSQRLEHPEQQQPEESPYVYTGSPTEVIHVPESPVPPAEPTCPHKGVMLRGTPVCGICQPEAFGFALLHVARRVAYKVRYSTYTRDDVIAAAAFALVANRDKILRAKNPTSLAYVIAERAAMKIWMNKSVDAMPVGKMNITETDGDGVKSEVEQTHDRLDHVNYPNVLAEIEEDYRRECYEAVRNLPGLDVMWTDANFRRLQAAIDEGIRLLPTTPVSAWSIISLRLGLNEELAAEDGSGWDWARIAERVSPSWKRLSPRDAGYLYTKGLGTLRDVIVSRLLNR